MAISSTHRFGAGRNPTSASGTVVVGRMRIVRQPMAREIHVQLPAEFLGGLRGEVVELDAGDLLIEPFGTDDVPDLADV